MDRREEKKIRKSQRQGRTKRKRHKGRKKRDR